MPSRSAVGRPSGPFEAHWSHEKAGLGEFWRRDASQLWRMTSDAIFWGGVQTRSLVFHTPVYSHAVSG